MKKNKIVLIIDDDADDRAIFFDALKEIDSTIQCISSGNGQEALKLLDNEKTLRPDFIFMDLNMPLLNGIQCLAEIKKDRKLSDIPVIIYSTSKRHEDIEETKKLGASHFLTKPTLFNDICSEIQMILSEKWGKNAAKRQT